MGRRLLVRFALVLACGLAGVLVAGICGAVYVLHGRPDLSVWHTAELDAEFTASSGVKTFEDYLALEERLFTQLDQDVYGAVPPEGDNRINRYEQGSLADPGKWDTNWNRTFEHPAENPAAAVLLLHGMSDSPYSMRNLGEHLGASGLYVLGLRVPGHGTAPSGLVRVRWEDMHAAVILAMRHLHEQVPSTPVYIIGYSNGGALALRYALATLEDGALPDASGLVLISPEIGVTKLAALAVWQGRLGQLLGSQKFAWSSILPEYDPFKYNSFAINAGNQAHRITADIQRRMTRLAESGAADELPPILAFQSVVDATVSAPALIQALFDRLPEGGHELVMFDMNQLAGINPLLKMSARDHIAALLKNPRRSFALTVVSNADPSSSDVIARHFESGGGVETQTRLNLRWPEGVYSLSHIALPFPSDDPLYGSLPNDGGPHLRLGNVTLRGERNVLRMNPTDLFRLRWNPFYDYLEERVGEFVGLGELAKAELADTVSAVTPSR